MKTVETDAILTLAQGHTGSVVGVERLRNGNILSYSRDGTLRLWDSKTGKLLHTLSGHKKKVDGVTILPSGNILSYSSDGTLCLWPQENEGREQIHGKWTL